MTQTPKESAEQRISRLETDVAEMRRLLVEIAKQVQTSKSETVAEKPSEKNPDVKAVIESQPVLQPTLAPLPGTGPIGKRLAGKSRPKRSINGEMLLNRIGIGLLLFGLAFLFKYSIDQGWLVPWVRIAFGLFLGGFLLYFGASKYRERQQFSQILLGGGIATLYITGFAAFQLYELIPHLLAFLYMVLVTLIAFFLAVQQSRVLLAIVGVVGGLGTPFLLHTGSGNLPGLLFYTSLVAAGSGAIYLIRRWRSLLWVAFVGTSLIFFITMVEGVGSSNSDLFVKWSAQFAALFAWLLFGGLAALSPLRIAILEPWQKWFGGQPSDPDAEVKNIWQLYSMMLAAPLLTKGYSAMIWNLQEETWGWIAIAFSLVYAGIAKLIWPVMNGEKVGYIHLLIATLLLTLGFCLVLDGNALLFTLAAQGTVMHYLARRFDDSGTHLRAHFLFTAALIWLLYRLFDSVPETAFFSTDAFTDLAIIGCGLLSSFALKNAGESLIYRIGVHALLMGWFAHELAAFDNGLALTSVVWGVYGVALLLVGLRLDSSAFRTGGLITLLVVVGKLFLFDLAGVAAIWRILLFMGFGGAFLLLGYFFPKLWQTSTEEDEKNQNIG